VEEYCAWRQMQVKKQDLKAKDQKAGDFIIEDGINFELIHEVQNPDFLMKRGINRGIASGSSATLATGPRSTSKLRHRNKQN